MTLTPALNAELWYISDGNYTNNVSLMIASGVTYSLSKATALNCQLGFVNNHGKFDTGLSTNGALFVPANIDATVGMRHIF